jgi:hypothetical protein
VIAVCTPARETVHATFAYDLAQLLRHVGDRAVFAIAQGSILPNLRAKLVEAALSAPAVTHVLFLDSDMRFAPDLLDKLLVVDVPIISAQAVTKDGNRTPTAWLSGHPLRPDHEGVVRVDRVGLAATLIQRGVFEGTPQPWFAFTWDKKAGKMAGEDVWFCDRAAEHGFAARVHCDVEVGHSGVAEHYNSGVSIP